MIVLGALMMAVFMASIETSIIATALPTITGEFSAFESFAWVGTAYIVTATIATPLLGKLSDLYGRRLIFQTTMGIFVVGSILCGASQSMGQLIGARAVQGLGGGAIQALAFAILGDILPPARARPLHRLLHARVRRRGAVRPARRRVHRRALLVAVDLLHQRAVRARSSRASATWRCDCRSRAARRSSTTPAPPCSPQRSHRLMIGLEEGSDGWTEPLVLGAVRGRARRRWCCSSWSSAAPPNR